MCEGMHVTAHSQAVDFLLSLLTKQISTADWKKRKSREAVQLKWTQTLDWIKCDLTSSYRMPATASINEAKHEMPLCKETSLSGKIAVRSAELSSVKKTLDPKRGSRFVKAWQFSKESVNLTRLASFCESSLSISRPPLQKQHGCGKFVFPNWVSLIHWKRKQPRNLISCSFVVTLINLCQLCLCFNITLDFYVCHRAL